MDKDFITINLESGEQKDAELISKFSIEGFGDYVIYKLDGKMYGAKYEVDGDKTNLITDLSEIEKDALYEVFTSLEVK